MGDQKRDPEIDIVEVLAGNQSTHPCRPILFLICLWHKFWDYIELPETGRSIYPCWLMWGHQNYLDPFGERAFNDWLECLIREADDQHAPSDDPPKS